MLIERALAVHEAGYEVVACRGKAPVFPGWQRGGATADTIRAWENDSRVTNIGILAGKIVAVDIDILDAGISERVKNLAMQMLGDTSLVRIGLSPKQLMVYRIAEPIRKKFASGVTNGTTHKVEVLGLGQQFVAFGRHPDTMQPYVWPEADLASVSADSVPEVTEAALDAFLAGLANIIGPPPKPAVQPEKPPQRLNGVNGHHQDRSDGVDAAEALEALHAIPCAQLDYHEWIRVGFALYAALGPSAASHYEAWSASDPARYKSDEPSRKFATFGQNEAIHPETLFWIAIENGWNPSKAAPVGDLGIFKRSSLSPPSPLPPHDPETGEVWEEPAEKVEPSPEQPRGMFTPYTWIDPSQIPPRRFLYGRHYIRQFLSTDISPGGIGKSSLVIAEDVAMAAHRDLLGTLPNERLKVAYWNGEDPLEELQRRVQAVCLHWGIKPDEIEGHLFVDSGRLLPLILAYEDRRKGPTVDQAVVDTIIASLVADKIDVLTIDPFIASHRVSENDNNAIEMVAKAWSHIADAACCSINLVHHSRKLNGEEVTVESGRGASALLAACRSARTLNQMSKDEAAQLGVENHRLYFRVDDGKSNLMPPAEGAVWHQLVNVDLPNGPMGTTGDKVGVVAKWEKVSPIAQLTTDDLRAVQNAVGSGQWRDNAQARDWVGKAIAQALKLSLPEEAPRVKNLIRAWLKSGALTIVRGLDQKRMPRDFVEVGNWVEPDD